VKTMMSKTILGTVVIGIGLFVVTSARGQSLTTGAIVGSIQDATGAAVPKAQVTVLSKERGFTRTTVSNSEGYYVAPQLDPGNYTVTVQAAGFQTISHENITLAVGHSVNINFQLQVGSMSEKVDVIAERAPLIETSNPNTTTTFNATQLATIPNPGNDLSYVANLAPGALISPASTTQGGSGNVEFNGLPSVANDFTIDGLDASNPYFNRNATGASGLQLGLNAIAEVSVNTTSYSVDQGRQEAAQINYITKSGTNSFHGNAYEIWNGSVMNANNFFNNMKGVKKPRSNVNEFGTSVGGPLLKDKLFFFADLEGIRIVLPTTLTSTLPTPAYQTFVLQQLPLGGMDLFPNPQTGNASLPPQPAEVPLYQSMFKLIGDTTGGIPLPVRGCPFDVGGGSPAVPNDGTGCATRKTFSVAPPASETLFTIKLDYTLSPKDTFWFRFQVNNGTSTNPDPVNSIFDTVLSAPVRSGAAGWTHVFSPSLVNQFNPGITYNKNLSNVADPSKAGAVLPLTFSATPFSPFGGRQFLVPSGSANTIWQLNDNLGWTRGRHALKFGVNMRRVLISSFATSLAAIPFVSGFSLPEFTYGAAGRTIQSFPKNIADRIALVNLDLYAMDTFRATKKLTFTIGLRTAWNSNPVSEHNTFSNLAGSFQTGSHDVNQPLNQVIIANQANAFTSTPPLQLQPRAALAYELRPKTVLRAGFGIFATTLESALGPRLLSINAPSDATFRGGLFGSVGGIAIIPGVPNSAIDAAVVANQRFQAGFASGTQSCASAQASPATCIPALSFNTFSGGHQGYPYSMQWSSSIERQFGKEFGLTFKYVGTRGIKMLYGNSLNGFQGWCQGCFGPLPFKVAPDPRFGNVFALNTGANSSYHALQMTGQKRVGHGLSFQLNYTYSHCLDTVSNDGFQQFNAVSLLNTLSANLRRYYGNCDYDVTHSVNGSYIYDLPLHPSKRWLDYTIGGWQVSGTVFLRGGFPTSVESSGTFTNFSNGSPLIYANLVPGQSPYAMTSIAGVTQPGTIQWLNPDAFRSVIDVTTNTCYPTTNVQNCQDGNLGRNTVRAPGFKWTDFDIGKRFKISEKIGFKFDAQFYNLFNHPNFYYPNFVAGIPGKTSTLTGFGGISQTASPSTGLLGGHLGGDSSVRMVALRGRIEF
jgi:hypothetical protein